MSKERPSQQPESDKKPDEQKPLVQRLVAVVLRKIDKGSENKVVEAHRLEPCDKSQDGLKIRVGDAIRALKVQAGIMSRIWRNQRSIYNKCIAAAKDVGLPHIETEMYDKATLIDGESGQATDHSDVLSSEYVKDVEEKTINYEKFLDKETGIQRQLESVSIIEKALEMEDKWELGLDAFGLSSILSILASVPPAILLKKFKKESIRGRDIKINNLVVHSSDEEAESPETKVIDMGFLDLSDEARLGFLMKFLYEITLTAIIETVLKANQDYAQMHGTLPNEEISSRLDAVKKKKIETDTRKIIKVKYLQSFSKMMLDLLSPILMKYITEENPEEAKTKKVEAERQKIAEKTKSQIETLIEEEKPRNLRRILKLSKRESLLESGKSPYTLCEKFGLRIKNLFAKSKQPVV